MTSSSAGALTANHNTNQVFNWLIKTVRNPIIALILPTTVSNDQYSHFLFKYQMYMGRSEFGNETDRAMSHALDTDIDALDDMERSKHYKTNIMQDFNDRQSGYGSRYVTQKFQTFKVSYTNIDEKCVILKYFEIHLISF